MTQTEVAHGSAGAAAAHEATGLLRLYVAGRSPKCAAALANLRRLCANELRGRFDVEVIDLLDNPRLASGDQIMAVPTLVRRLPPPVKRIIGDLSATDRVLVGLELKRLVHK